MSLTKGGGGTNLSFGPKETGIIGELEAPYDKHDPDRKIELLNTIANLLDCETDVEMLTESILDYNEVKDNEREALYEKLSDLNLIGSRFPLPYAI